MEQAGRKDARTKLRKLLDRGFERAALGDEKWAKLLIERADGSPFQALPPPDSPEGTGPINLAQLTTDELKIFVTLYAKARPGAVPEPARDRKSVV